MLPDIGKQRGSSIASFVRRKIAFFTTLFVDDSESTRWRLISLRSVIEFKSKLEAEDSISSSRYTCCEDVVRFRKDEEAVLPSLILSV